MEEEECEHQIMNEAMVTIMASTSVVLTPEVDRKLGDETTVWLYSQGMVDNHNLPDVEMRGVPSMFMRTAHEIINELNAYRIALAEKPLEVGHNVSWPTGDFTIVKGEDYCLRLASTKPHIGCVCCEMKAAGVTE